MDCKTPRFVQSGSYYTDSRYHIFNGKIYGTNTDPATFGDAKDEANYDLVCDLTMGTEAPTPSYRYLAFYGEPGSSGAPTFHELELTLGTPLNGSSEIKYGVNDTGITFYESKAWEYSANDYSTIMNGVKGWSSDPNHLRYNSVEDTNAIFWYMDMGTGVAIDVNGGTFWTYGDDGSVNAISFTLGKLYGTNTDPATLGDASLIENYEFVCDLNRQTSS